MFPAAGPGERQMCMHGIKACIGCSQVSYCVHLQGFGEPQHSFSFLLFFFCENATVRQIKSTKLACFFTRMLTLSILFVFFLPRPLAQFFCLIHDQSTWMCAKHCHLFSSSSLASLSHSSRREIPELVLTARSSTCLVIKWPCICLTAPGGLH